MKQDNFGGYASESGMRTFIRLTFTLFNTLRTFLGAV
jgi:hypothetical protein